VNNEKEERKNKIFCITGTTPSFLFSIYPLHNMTMCATISFGL